MKSPAAHIFSEESEEIETARADRMCVLPALLKYLISNTLCLGHLYMNWIRENKVTAVLVVATTEFDLLSGSSLSFSFTVIGSEAIFTQNFVFS